MEPPNKIPRTNTKNPNHHQPPTLITDLPETLIHLITSYLSLEDICRLSASSKTYRNLFYTTPSLTLDVENILRVHPAGPNRAKFGHYLMFVERVFCRRCQLPLDCFKLVSIPFLGLEYRYETWIINSLNCRVKELDLDLRKTCNIPLEVFSHSWLKVLKLNMNYSSLQLPNSIKFTNLQTLTISSAKLRDSPLSPWLATQCPLLNSLSLEYCWGFTTLLVVNSSLENFRFYGQQKSSMKRFHVSCQKLKAFDVAFISTFHTDSSFTLYAPDLQSFTWSGRVFSKCHAYSMTSLQTAKIRNLLVSRRRDYCQVLYKFGIKLLALVKYAKSLELCSSSMQILARALRFETTSSLAVIDSLKLYTHLSTIELWSIILLLERSPTLRVVTIARETYNKEMPVDIHLNNEINKPLNMGIVNNLREAKITLFGSGTENLEMVKFLVKNAKLLEMVTLLYSGSDHELAKQILRKLQDIKIPPSLTKIFLVPE